MFSRLIAGACSLLLGAASVALSRPDQSPPRPIERLEQWLEAANDHEPGASDAPAQNVSSWSTTELESLFPYVKALVELVGQDAIKPGWAVFTAVEVERLKNLAASTRRNNINYVMKRGALLHSDIAMNVPQDTTPVPGPPPRPSRAPQRTGARFSLPRRPTVLGDDGRYQAFGREAIHWEFSRMLLESVRPSPSLDGMVRLWYQAVAAYFSGKYLLAQALHHLERAQQLFPHDSELLLDRGCLHETFAAPRIQAVIETTILPAGVKLLVAGASSNLREAERYFRAALEGDHDLTEARVRLARVLLLQGRPEQARTELRREVVSTEDSVLRYYSQLFLASAEQALGNLDAAREAYEKAAVLYPRAQSPRLGLSQLARHRGDRPGAVGFIQQVLSLPSNEREREDPWWRYHEGIGRYAEARLADVRAVVRGERR